MSKRYDVKTPRPKKDGSNYWFRIGTAFEDDKGITVYLDGYPLPDKDGRVVMKLWEPLPRDGNAPRSDARMDEGWQSGGGLSKQIDDEIPF